MNAAEYQEYLHSDRWKALRASVFKRVADPRCYCCEKRKAAGWYLEVHHLTYERVGRELPGDLVLVCEWCHRSIHDAAKKEGKSIRDITEARRTKYRNGSRKGARKVPFVRRRG